MKKVMSEEKKARRPDLIEYDRSNVSPHYTPELIRYIESRQPGLTARDHAKLDEIEWFVLNLNHGGLVALAVPGLRTYPSSESRYIKRFNDDPYDKMLRYFLSYVPPHFPEDQIERYNLRAFKLTSPHGEQFYPIHYNDNLPVEKTS